MSRRDILRLPEVRDAFPPAGNPGDFLRAKIAELNDRAAARTRAAAAAGYQMRLGAFRVRRGTDPIPVHLPGYDTYNTLNPAPLPRITTNVSPAEAAEQAREVKATQQLIELTKTKLSDVVAKYQQEVDALKQKLQAQVASLTNGASGAISVAAGLKKLGDDLTTLGTKQNSDGLKKAGKDVTALAASVQALTSTLASVQTSISTIQASFANVTQGATSPDVVLRNILGLTNAGGGELAAAVTSARAQVKDIEAGLAAVHADAKALATNQADIKTLEDRVRAEVLDLVTAPLGQLVGPDLVRFLGEVRDSARAAAPLIDLKAPEILTVSDIVTTRLEIPRADPADGDVIDLATQVFQGDKLVYEEHRSVTVHFYGWHSGLASGLIFVRGDKAALSNFKPEAAAIWRVQMTPRPDGANAFYKLRPAVGIHTTTLHFNDASTTAAGTTTTTNNNNNVQFGTGITFHLLGDVVQVGYGWNLGVTKNRGYMYAGIGIMKLLRDRLSQSINGQ
jgi:hypothetical protein